jgi:hypothetical protein
MEPNKLIDKLGLHHEMSTYFLRAPQEYWQELGFKQAPYDDNTGEYDFIHAFFTNKEEMSNFADILISKLSHNGIMWISWPKLSDLNDISMQIDQQDVLDTFVPLGLKDDASCQITDHWLGLKFIWPTA